jgi:AcrR family transcriptional regulator
MSPRPKATSDEAILGATQRAVMRIGPMRLTLAHVAREAGVSPATLVQRFGSKRKLLLALVASGAGGMDEQYEALRAHRTPLAAIYAYAECMADLAASPEVLANSLSFLQMDLVDPEFHKHALAQARWTRAWLKARLDEAVAGGELGPCDTNRLSRGVQVMVGGSLLQWAIDRDGKLRSRLREDTESLLQPYTRVRRRPRRPAKAARRRSL